MPSVARRPAPARDAVTTAPALRRTPEERRRKSGPALRAFFRIAETWGLDVDEQRGLLGWPSRSAFYNWKAGRAVTLPYDTLVRISLVLGIYKALHILYPEDEFWDDLLRVTGGETTEHLARLTIRSSEDLDEWMAERGVKWQKPIAYHYGDTYTTKLLPGFSLLIDPLA